MAQRTHWGWVETSGPGHAPHEYLIPSTSICLSCVAFLTSNKCQGHVSKTDGGNAGSVLMTRRRFIIARLCNGIPDTLNGNDVPTNGRLFSRPPSIRWRNKNHSSWNISCVNVTSHDELAL